MFPRQLHDRVEPFPESEISIVQWFFAKLSPAEQLVCIRVVASKCFIGQKTNVIFS